MLDLFKGREFKIAAWKNGHFEPVELSDAPFISPGKLNHLHISGRQCLGFYLCDSNWCVHCSCADIDDKEHDRNPEWKSQVEQIYNTLVKLGLSPLVEISQSGSGAHVWLFFSEAVSARGVRKLWSLVSARCGVVLREVYPRSDAPRGQGLGNLVRYPLWGQSRFVDIDDEWRDIDPSVAMSSVEKISNERLSDLISELGGKDEEKDFEVQDNGIPERVQRILSRPGIIQRRWEGDSSGLRDPSRSGLALSICSLLVKSFIPTEDIRQSLIAWGKANSLTKVDRPDWVASTLERAYTVSDESKDCTPTSVSTLYDSSIEFADRLRLGPPKLISCGVEEVDDVLGGGVGLGELLIVGARPSMGKSAWVMQMIENASIAGEPCLVISLEMRREQLSYRHIQRLYGGDSKSWYRNIDDIKSCLEREHKHRAPVYIAQDAWDIDRIEKTIRQHVQQSGVKIVAVDYAQLVRSTSHKSEYDRISESTRVIAQLTKELNITTALLAQIGRDGETDDKGRVTLPRLRHLKGSGELEQSADAAILLHWNWRANPQENKNDYTAIVAKNRMRGINGDMVVNTKFDPERQTFGIANDGCEIGSEFLV
jgi:replicative DNA helicase